MTVATADYCVPISFAPCFTSSSRSSASCRFISTHHSANAKWCATRKLIAYHHSRRMLHLSSMLSSLCEASWTRLHSFTFASMNTSRPWQGICVVFYFLHILDRANRCTYLSEEDLRIFKTSVNLRQWLRILATWRLTALSLRAP